MASLSGMGTTTAILVKASVMHRTCLLPLLDLSGPNRSACIRMLGPFGIGSGASGAGLVLLFFVMFLLPFEFRVAGLTIPFPDWIKATFGLALPIMANMAEIVRGAVQSIPTAQWEAARSLAFSRRQILWQVILPQCIKRMLPPWMNWYAILTMATTLASVVGVSEVMTITGRITAAEARTDLLVPIYSYVLLWFFIYCYPIAWWTRRLELRYSER